MAEIDLNDLADRVEKLEGPCRETDAEIALAIGRFYLAEPRYEGAGRMYGYVDQDGSRVEPGNGSGASLIPRYTASIDAAMTLVPEGMEASVHWRKGDSYVGRAMVAVPFSTEAVGRICATPAIALTACALRARLMDGEGEK